MTSPRWRKFPRDFNILREASDQLAMALVVLYGDGGQLSEIRDQGEMQIADSVVNHMTEKHCEFRTSDFEAKEEPNMTIRFLRLISGNSQSAIRIPILFFLLGSLLLAPCLPAEAQQPTKIPRVGYLATNSLSAISARVEALRHGLRELGYVEGKNIVIEWRFAEEKPDRLPALAAELVRLKVDIIVTAGPAVTRVAKEATVTIPIVMTFDNDPVGSGLVASLAQPGGNITGLSTLAPELSGKQLELLKEIVPKLSRVAVFGTSTVPGYAQVLKEIELAAGALGVKLQYLDVLGPKDIEIAFRAASKGRAGAVLVLASAVLFSERTQVVDLAVKNRFPTIYFRSDFVEAGGLTSYSASFSDLDRRAATYVDKILKGRKPADLPVEQPSKFEFVINLKAAKQIGLIISPNVLAQADRVIR